MGYIPIKTPGGTIWAEIEDTDQADTPSLASIKDDALRSFQESVEALKTNAQYVIQSLEALGPEEMEVTCGIKVGVEGGTPFFGLAKASGEASYTIKLKWKANEVESS